MSATSLCNAAQLLRTFAHAHDGHAVVADHAADQDLAAVADRSGRELDGIHHHVDVGSHIDDGI
ncbi:MAG TPA: hypothetical protein VF532_03130 [Candidatus Angelobacter sp.]